MPKKITGKKYPFIFRQLDKVVVLVVLGLLILLYPGQGVFVMSAAEGEKTHPLLNIPFPLPSPAPYPVNFTGVYPGGEVTAQGVVVLDVDSGVYLYRRNELSSLAPASTTKILTALVALELYNLDDVVTVGVVPTEGQLMGLVFGEQITVENLLYGALIHSGNDAAFALAAYHPDGVDGFVAAMNRKAQELSLVNSYFTNPVGYDDPNHRMTPMDLARLASIALTNKTIAKMVAIPQMTLSDVAFTHFHSLTNVNQLLGRIPGVGGIKTGWTQEAGENLVTLAFRNDHKVIIVVLNSLDRFGDTESLIGWVYSNYRWDVFKSVEL